MWCATDLLGDDANVTLQVMKTEEPPEGASTGLEVSCVGSSAPTGFIYQVVIASNLAPRIVAIFLDCQHPAATVRRVSLRLTPKQDGRVCAEFVAQRLPEWNIVVRYRKDANLVDYFWFRDKTRP